MVTSCSEMIPLTRSPIESTPLHFVRFEHGQVTDPLLCDDRHALLDRCCGETVITGLLMISLDAGLLRGAPLEDHLARIVALGEHADQPPLRHHQQGADPLAAIISTAS